MAKGSFGQIDISIELKSVNSRYLECSVRIPRMYLAIEEELKSMVGKSISRGKVDVFITIDTSKSKDIEIKVNSHLAQAYIDSLRQLAKDNQLSDEISVIDIAKFPDVLSAEKIETDPKELSEKICSVLKEALDHFSQMREREGAILLDDVKKRLDEITSLTLIAEELSPRTVDSYKNRLEEKLREFLQTSDIDEQRLMTEVAIFADRVAINEEIVRLKSHIKQLQELLESDEPIGRKIDFLLQEFNREANTIGSKGNDGQMSKTIVDLKAEIEKIREMAQNIE